MIFYAKFPSHQYFAILLDQNDTSVQSEIVIKTCPWQRSFIDGNDDSTFLYNIHDFYKSFLELIKKSNNFVFSNGVE